MKLVGFVHLPLFERTLEDGKTQVGCDNPRVHARHEDLKSVAGILRAIAGELEQQASPLVLPPGLGTH